MNKAFSEKDFGRLIRRTLSSGVFLSLFFFFLGFGLRFSGSSCSASALKTGVFLLALTPAARVAMLIYGYWRTKEYHFALAAIIVLVLLGASALL